MNGIANVWGRIGLQFRLQILIQGALIIVLLAAQYWISNRFEQQILTAAQDRAGTIADGAINGLNTLMVTKVGNEDVISNSASRALFIQKMGVADKVTELRVIRSKAVDDEFDVGLPQERPVDEMDKRVLASGKTENRLITGNESGAYLRTVMPFVAKANFRTTNCLSCHAVNEGAVLGAASVTINIREDMENIGRIKAWFWAAQAGLQIILTLFMRMIVRLLLRDLGGEPGYVTLIVKRIAAGNLAGEIITRPNDTGSLLAAMKQMQGNLKSNIGQTARIADTLKQAARRLSASSQQVLSASERQTDASASAAAAVEEMTACIGQISDNAVDASRSASETGDLAKRGAGAVREVIVDMDQISESAKTSSGLVSRLGEDSRQISKIVGVIKEIAEQTNLLALNAAIEAARAGEQGRGFAVVADEVRRLAERTTRSTQEIAAMIDAIQKGTGDVVTGMSLECGRVDEGVRVVSRASDSMAEIDAGVQRVLTSVAHISSALSEQSAASNLIARNVEGIAEMTGHTSAIVKELSGSAEHLQQLADQLEESVGQFSL
jgi:methyl-accepting chemotaxis protein